MTAASERVVRGERRCVAEVGRAGGVGRAGVERRDERVVERRGRLGVVGGTVEGQVHGTVEVEGPDVLRVARRVRLHVLRPVALAVEVELVDLEVLADRLQVLDRLARRVQRQLGLGDAALGEARGDVGAGDPARLLGLAPGRSGSAGLA